MNKGLIINTLAIFDRKNYDIKLPRCIRNSSRAIIMIDKRIALLYETKYKIYVFPGGKIENNETNIEALIRETKEEAGLIVKPESIIDYGIVTEIRKDIYVEGIFEQNDYYYICEIESEIIKQELTEEEKGLGYLLNFISLEKAISINEIEINTGKRFSERETFILKSLMNNSNCTNE